MVLLNLIDAAIWTGQQVPGICVSLSCLAFRGGDGGQLLMPVWQTLPP